MEAESFDKKIRDLLDSAEFPYQEADWQKAKKLLQQERKRRAIGWLWLLPFLAIGSSWWMLLASEPEKSSFDQRYILAANKNETEQIQTVVAEDAVSPLQSTAESASTIKNTVLHARTKSGKQKQQELGQQQNILPSQALETNNNETSVEIDQLVAKSAQLAPGKLAETYPEKRPEVLLNFDRPNTQTAPILTMGFWAATQPVWNSSSEKSAGSLNWQTGLMAAMQWQNGFYSQWLGGIQQQQLRNWTYTNVNTTYDFGFERTTQTLDLRNYWSLQNSLRLGFQKGNHRIFGSFTHQHYLFSQYRITTDIERQDAPRTTEKENGLATLQQAQLVNWLPGLGYEYSLNKTFHVGAMYQFRPSNAPNATLPAAGAWQFSLQYVLFQRQKP